MLFYQRPVLLVYMPLIFQFLALVTPSDVNVIHAAMYPQNFACVATCVLYSWKLTFEK